MLRACTSVVPLSRHALQWGLPRAFSTAAPGKVHLQLDYFMSSQFAGVALALHHKLYEAAGLAVTILPEVEPGREPQAVLAAQAQTPDAVCVGTIEQNVLFPCVAEEAADVTAVAAMFGKSPLCLATLPGSSVTAAEIAATDGAGLTVGAHVDTVALLQRILPKAKVIPVSRNDKLGLLQAGKITAVQAYNLMEPLALSKRLGQMPGVFPLAACSKAPVELGYSQVLFAPTASLSGQHAATLKKFLEVTFAGWEKAAQDVEGAAKVVVAMQPKNIDHWVNDEEFTVHTLERCCGYVLMTQKGMNPKLGVIDPVRWRNANEWLAASSKWAIRPEQFPRLDTNLWTF